MEFLKYMHPYIGSRFKLHLTFKNFDYGNFE